MALRKFCIHSLHIVRYFIINYSKHTSSKDWNPVRRAIVLRLKYFNVVLTLKGYSMDSLELQIHWLLHRCKRNHCRKNTFLECTTNNSCKVAGVKLQIITFKQKNWSSVKNANLLQKTFTYGALPIRKRLIWKSEFSPKKYKYIKAKQKWKAVWKTANCHRRSEFGNIFVLKIHLG